MIRAQDKIRQRLLKGICAALLVLSAHESYSACEPCDRASNAGLVPIMIGQSNNFAVRRSGIEVDAKWKVPVSKDGWYRLTQSQLVTAGMLSNQLVGSQIRMYTRTQEVAILVTSTSLLGSGDAVYFYGTQHDGTYNRTNAYWLGLGGAGRRISSVSGAPVGEETTITAVCFSAVYNPKLLHRPYHQPEDTDIDHWFAAQLTNNNLTPILLNTSNRVSGETANLSIILYGLTTVTSTNPDHQTRIKLNSTVIASPTYDGPHLFSTNYVITNDVLISGTTTGVLDQTGNTLPGVSSDSAYLMSLRIDYLATNLMRSPSHEFCGKAGTNRYRVANVATNGGFWVLDISDPYNPVLIANPIVTNNATVEFRYVSTNVTRLALVQSNGLLEAATPQEIVFRNLGDTSRRADYLMITPNEFRDHAYRLAKQRYTNGLAVVVAPLPDVYNEFGYGVVDTTSIKEFIGYTYHFWTKPRPRFALLIGEGTYDPLGYLGKIPLHNIPVPIGPTPFVVGAQDVWYGLVDGSTNAGNDFFADVVIGRMSISSNSPLSNIVNKVMAYDAGVFSTNAFLVADSNDGDNNFTNSIDTHIRPFLATNGFAINSLTPPYLTSLATATISNAITSGRRLVTFVGHGALDRWTAANIWNITNINYLANSVYPLVVIFSCQNGSFVEAETNSLSEAFIEVRGGAASVFSPTALSVQIFADKMAEGFMNSYASKKRRYLGDVVFDAYLNLWSLNTTAAELLTYEILGDPGMIVNKPGTLPP